MLVNGLTFEIHTTPLRSRDGMLQTNDPLSMFPCNLGIGRRRDRICVSMEQHRMHSIQVVCIPAMALRASCLMVMPSLLQVLFGVECPTRDCENVNSVFELVLTKR